MNTWYKEYKQGICYKNIAPWDNWEVSLLLWGSHSGMTKVVFGEGGEERIKYVKINACIPPQITVSLVSNILIAFPSL